MNELLRQRKMEDLVVVDEGNCWVWQGTTSRGYGKYGGKNAHRVYWKLVNGDLEDDIELDHLCENRACINPHHLEPVTHIENVRRSKSARLLEYCRSGRHKMEGSNLRIYGNKRSCRACFNEYQRRYDEKIRHTSGN